MFLSSSSAIRSLFISASMSPGVILQNLKDSFKVIITLMMGVIYISRWVELFSNLPFRGGGANRILTTRNAGVWVLLAFFTY